MLDDAAYLDRLRAIFAANDPADGIDRHDYPGFGADVRVTGLRRVPGEYGDELDVEFEFEVPRRFRRSVRGRGATRLDFGREWRRLSGYEDPAAYAPRIAHQVWFAVAETVQAERDGRRPSHDVVGRSLPSEDVLYDGLLAALSESGRAELVEPGVIRLHRGHLGDGDIEIRVTPHQWREYVIGCEVSAWTDPGVDAWRPGDGLGMAVLYLDESIGPRTDDERFVVFHRGELERSVRAELPPVPGRREPVPRMDDDEIDWRT